MNINKAKEKLDTVIGKARVHFYKPIQVAEILRRHRVDGNINLANLEDYHTVSKRWRDVICQRFIGRVSTSSAKYQDDLFNDNATPPEALVALGQENVAKNGIVEAYIYSCLERKMSQMSLGLDYCYQKTVEDFSLEEFLDLFWKEPGLKRSIDKIYEIIVYALFTSLVDAIGITVTLRVNEDNLEILREFEDFAAKVISIDCDHTTFSTDARLYRVGVTNAADRGLDMWANFGPAVQIKHLSLDEELAEDIVETVSADRIVIVCKSCESKIIYSLTNQLGWKARIQSIVTEEELLTWYEKALRGKYSSVMGEPLLDIIRNEIRAEFPSADTSDLRAFCNKRYGDCKLDSMWSLD